MVTSVHIVACNQYFCRINIVQPHDCEKACLGVLILANISFWHQTMKPLPLRCVEYRAMSTLVSFILTIPLETHLRGQHKDGSWTLFFFCCEGELCRLCWTLSSPQKQPLSSFPWLNNVTESHFLLRSSDVKLGAWSQHYETLFFGSVWCSPSWRIKKHCGRTI